MSPSPCGWLFGIGTLKKLVSEIDLLGARKALVLVHARPGSGCRTRRERSSARARPGSLRRAVMHVPIETAREARALAQRLGADCALAIGGGSTIGLGKAIALESGLPILAIPTTYAGSEMTPIYGLDRGW